MVFSNLPTGQMDPDKVFGHLNGWFGDLVKPLFVFGG